MTAPRSLLIWLPLLLLLPSCLGSRKGVDPTLRILSERGDELGVSTDYGVIFLGRNTNAGPVDIEANFGDGPSIESSVVEPLGGGLFTAETDIRLPSVPLTFKDLKPGQSVLVKGRSDRGSWKRTARVRQDERVLGLLIEPVRELSGRPDQVGAGVYIKEGRGVNNLRLIGLVSGRIHLTKNGNRRSYLTVEGPQSLWRLVTHRRKVERKRKWVYREDVL